jgi:hypothetical protein
MSEGFMPPTTRKLLALSEEGKLTRSPDGTSLQFQGATVAILVKSESGRNYYRDAQQAVPADCEWRCVEWFCPGYPPETPPEPGGPKPDCICIKHRCVPIRANDRLSVSELVAPSSTEDLVGLLIGRKLNLSADGSALVFEGRPVAVRVGQEDDRHLFRDINQVLPTASDCECAEWICWDEEQPFGPPRKICICKSWICPGQPRPVP